MYLAAVGLPCCGGNGILVTEKKRLCGGSGLRGLGANQSEAAFAACAQSAYNEHVGSLGGGDIALAGMMCNGGCVSALGRDVSVFSSTHCSPLPQNRIALPFVAD